MNNKLLKRFLITTALGAASFSGIADVMANDVGANSDTDANIALDQSYNFNNDDGELTINHQDEDTHVTKVTSGVQNAKITVSGFTTIIGTVEQRSYIMDKLTGDNGGTKFTITTTKAGSTLTITEVRGAGSSVIVDGINNNITLVTVGEVVNALALLEVKGDDNAALTITGESHATAYTVTQGTMTIKADAHGDFTVADNANAKLIFDSTGLGAAITATGNTTLEGANSTITFNAANNDDIIYKNNITATNAGEGQVIASGAGITSINGTVGGNNAVALIQVNEANANLVLQGESHATAYNVDQGKMTIKANATANAGNGAFTVADGAKLVFQTNVPAADIIATGSVNLTGANGTLETIAAGGNNITITGTVEHGELLISGAGTTIIEGIVGNNNATAIKFGAAGTLKLNAGVANGTLVDFDSKAGTIIVGGKDTTFGNITDPNGSTIRMETDHNLTLGIAGAAGKLLNIDGTKIANAANSITVANNSFFNEIQTGAGFLKLAAVGTISVKSIDGNVSVGANNLTINALEKDVMKSGKLTFTDTGVFTLAKDFGIFGAEVTAPGANNGKIAFLNSGTITSKIMGSNVADDLLDSVNFRGGSFSLNTVGAAHYIDILTVEGNAKVKLESNYNTSNNFTVAAGGSLDLAKSTLTANKVDMEVGANLIVSDKGKISGNVANKAFTLTLDSSAKGKKTLIMSNGGNKLDLKEGTVKVKEDNNSLADDIFHICDANGNQVANGTQGTHGFFGRIINNTKVKNSLDQITESGNAKAFINSFEKLDANSFTGDSRNFIIDAGSIKDSGERNSYILSAIPRNLS